MMVGTSGVCGLYGRIVYSLMPGCMTPNRIPVAGGKRVREMSSADYWQRTEAELCPGGDRSLCPFLLFTDGSWLDKLGRFVVKLALLGCGNLKNEAQRRLKSRAVLGLIPELKVTIAQGSSVHVKRARLSIHHQAIDKMMASVKVKEGYFWQEE